MEEHEELTAAEEAHAHERDEQSNLNMDDINIPLVAVSVLFFGVLLAVTIASLQAWFYHEQTAIREANTLPRDYYVAATTQSAEQGTNLGILWHKQRTELHDPEHAVSRVAVEPGKKPPSMPKRISIDEAIATIVRDGEK